MKFEKSIELNEYLDQLSDIYELNLSISDLLSSIFGNVEITNKKEISLLTKRFDISEKDALVSKIADYLDIDLEVEDNEEIFNTCIKDVINELDLSNYQDDPYYKLIKDINIKQGEYELVMDHYEPYEIFAYKDMSHKDYLEVNSLGYFKERFDFPALNHKGITWMNITPNEIETMSKAIKEVHGEVIVFGLGLGYFAYMASNRNEIKHITVIENDQKIIDMFNKYLFPNFINKEKIVIIKDDAFHYLDKELKVDYAFVDLWHSPEDGVETFLKFKKSESHSPNTKFFYWLESSFYLYLRRCFMGLLIESRLGYKESDYQSTKTVSDRILRHYYTKTKDLVISNKAQIDNLLNDKSLIELLLN